MINTRLICPSTYRLTILRICNILPTSSILQRTLKHFFFPFLTHELNLKRLAIIFGHGFWWCNINCFSSSKDLSPGFNGAVNPLSNLYIIILHELSNIAFLCNSSEILFPSKKNSNYSIYVFQSSSLGWNSDTTPMVIDISLPFLITIYVQIRNK